MIPLCMFCDVFRARGNVQENGIDDKEGGEIQVK
jgi:hypothetical protein